MGRYLCRLLHVCGCLLLLFDTAHADLSVGNYTLVSQVRVSRTAYDYTYKADLTNTGGPVTNVSAALASASPATTIIDGDLNFGDISANSSVTSSDTFTIRQDRTVPFDAAALVWNITAEPVIFTVSNLKLVKTKRVGRTAYEYTYTADLTNYGEAVINAAATVTSTSPSTIIIEGELSFGDVPQGATVTSTDTFTFQQDRTVAFDPGVLVWATRADPAVPKPPVVTVTSPLPGAVVNTPSITVRGSVSDPAAHVAVQGVSATVTGTEFVAAGVKLSEGGNELQVRSWNEAGLTSSTTHAVVLDTIPPSMSLVSPPNRLVLTEATSTVSGIVNDATAVTCSVADEAASIQNGVFSRSVTLTTGLNHISAVCVDAAGNAATRGVDVFHDPDPLRVESVQPADGNTEVAPDATITTTFSEAVDPSSITSGTFLLRRGAALLASNVVVAADGRSATAAPVSALPSGSTIDVVLSTGIRDLDGNPMPLRFYSRFTTAGIASSSGILIGEVYDDTHSLPLKDAVVEAMVPETGQLLESAVTDAQGRYLLAAGQSDVDVHIAKLASRRRSAGSPALAMGLLKFPILALLRCRMRSL